MGKGRGRKGSESESEELDDVQAWGSKRQNYYQQSESEYSSLEEQQAEAHEIYQKQIQNVAEDEYYDLPQGQEEEVGEGEEEPQQEVSKQYLTKQIQKTAKLGLKIADESQSDVKSLLQSHIQNYLMALIAMRDLDVPYLEHHPITNTAAELHRDIQKLSRVFERRTNTQRSTHQGKDRGDWEEESEGDEQGDEGEEESVDEDHKEGMRIYEQEKARQVEAKKAKKESRQKERQSSKKPTFAEVQEREGRLASELILKNKGLMKPRKKIDRNSRVKHRLRYAKASSKRRAYGHFTRQDPGREYEGERNIKYGRIGSRKIK